METMWINGVDVSKWIRIIAVDRPIGNDRHIVTNDAPFLGVNIQEIRTGAKVIAVRFLVQATTGRQAEEIKHQLAGLFHTVEPLRIAFSDEPDKYYLGFVNGEVTMDSVTRWFQKGELSFLIPDGVAHSTAYRRFDTPTVGSDKLTFTLTNQGNVAAFPIVKVRHNAENGYIGLVNTSGVLEVGNREEADTTTALRSQVLWNYRDEAIATGLSTARKNVAVLNDTGQKLTGAIAKQSLWGRSHLYLSKRGGTSGNNGSSLSWDISDGSLHDYLWWRQIFWAGAVNQYGFIKVMVSDTDGKFLYGVETYKRSNGLDCEYNFLASDGKNGYNLLKKWSFQATDKDTHNPFNQNRGWSDLRRDDDVVTVFWWGTYNKFVIPELKGRKSARVHVSFGAVGNHPLVTHMYLDGIYYQKNQVASEVDIPNRYPSGSTVVLDSETDQITVDGLERLSDLVHGSAFLTIPPGTSTLEVYCSNWLATKPTVTVAFEERWL